MLLLDIFCVFRNSQKDRLHTRRLIEGLSGHGDRPSGEMLRGRPVTERWVAFQLRPYGIRPKVFKVDGCRGRGYLEQDMMDTFRRYIPRSELEALYADTEKDGEVKTAA